MKVLFVDNHILVCEKPAGIATQPDFENQAKAWVKKEYNKPGAVFLHPIHRLDKPVSGIVLFARTSKALSRLQEAQRNRQMEKIYWAQCDPMPTKKEGELIHRLLHGDHKALISDEGKEARLVYKTVEDHLEIHLLTGRYHQIRAQLAAIGSPLLGDKKYGSAKPYQEGAIALKHVRLSFPHPISKMMMEFSLG